MQQQTSSLSDHLAGLWKEGTEGGSSLYHRRYYADGIAWAEGTGRLSQRAESYLDTLSLEELREMIDGWHTQSYFTDAAGRKRHFAQGDIPTFLNDLERILREELSCETERLEVLSQEHDFIGRDLAAFNAPSECDHLAYKGCERDIEATEAKIRKLHDHLERYTGEHPAPHFFCPGCEICSSVDESDFEDLIF